MIKLILITFLGLSLLSCSEKKEKMISSINKKTSNSNKIIEKYFPKEQTTNRFDTTIIGTNLTISIINNTLDTYVTNEFESDGFNYIYKYRDYGKRLIIKLKDKTIIDTLFKKDNFLNYAGKDFIKTAIFHGYFFNKIDGETIQLFGIISKPETDWSYTFYHYFDLKTKQFKIKESDNEEE